MKRIVSLVVMLMCVLPSFAQTHMKFKGIDIDGSFTSFISKLKATGGYKDLRLDGELVGVEGSFAGYSNVTIMPVKTAKTSTVWKVAVFLDDSESWSTLKSQYRTLKENLSLKYGTPQSYEFFSDPYYEGDGYEIQALRKEKCTWVSFFEAEEGTVYVEITSTGYKGCVHIVYEDKANTAIKNAEKRTQVLNDL